MIKFKLKAKRSIYLIICGLLSLNAYSQEKYTISGIAKNLESNETLIGVTVAVPKLNTGVVSNEYGFYSLSLPAGEYQLVISYLGFKNQSRTVKLDKNTKLNFEMVENAQSLDEVIVTGDVETLSLRKPQMSVSALSSGTIKKIPTVLGESDVIKSILLLPGVTSAGEGASGFNVRGGASDQNLILLDEAIVFNTSHLFGFFSVFNPDAIKDLKLYKGGIPAKYGGRVSSVLDIYQKEGNSKNFKVTGGIGAVASRLLVEGPIVEDKAAFVVAGRASYAHLFLTLADNDNSAYFYDLNTKFNYKLNDRNSLYVSGYFGRDVLSFADSFKNTYGNSILNLRWNHLFSDKLFANASAIYSDYDYGLELDFVGFKWDSGILNYNLKYGIDHYVSKNLKLNYGLNEIYYQFNPGEIEPNSENSGILSRDLIKKYANEFAAYLDIEQTLTENLTFRYGLRWSHFVRLGQDELNVYEDDRAVTYNGQFNIYQEGNPIDVENYNRRDVLESFNNVEPRASLSYQLDPESSVKMGYNRMSQYLHLLSNTSSATPLDVWTPSGPFIKPQLLDQYAIGYYKKFNNNLFSLESEVFYKTVKNRIDYIDGADLIGNDAIEQVILNGEARAYGLEVLLKKNKGRFTGWLAYTVSKSEQRTPGRDTVEPGINNGNWYNTPYDKTHDISLTGSYELNEKWTFSGNFLFQTGQPTNYPIGQYKQLGLSIPIYGERNEERLPAYHRLDLTATLTPKKNEGRKWKSEWIFGFYNIYNRANAASVSFRRNTDTGVNEAIKTSIFGIVPSVGYNFKF